MACFRHSCTGKICLGILTVMVSCGGRGTHIEHATANSGEGHGQSTHPENKSEPEIISRDQAAAESGFGVPNSRPPNWNPFTFNLYRGKRGSIPKDYLAQIIEEGVLEKKLGMHLPYVPKLSKEKREQVPKGYLPLMWGDPSKGNAMFLHQEANGDQQGVWFDWIRIRKAVIGRADESQSRYQGWPQTPAGSGSYMADQGESLTAQDGKHTVYLAQLPGDVRGGDLVRVWGHCKARGEYIDFVVVPEWAVAEQTVIYGE